MPRCELIPGAAKSQPTPLRLRRLTMKTTSQRALRRHGLALSIATALVCASSLTMAQNAPVPAPPTPPQNPAPDGQDQQKTTDLQTITVTGSALPRIDVETP